MLRQRAGAMHRAQASGTQRVAVKTRARQVGDAPVHAAALACSLMLCSSAPALAVGLESIDGFGSLPSVESLAKISGGSSRRAP